jgi:hypothetical protein
MTFAPVLALIVSVLALVLTHARDFDSKFLSDIERVEYFEAIWSLLLAGVAFWILRKNGSSSRTFGWLSGLIGFVGMVTAFIIPLSSLVLSASAPVLQTHEQVSLALTYVAWALGISWTVQVFVSSVSGGDWSRTVWARLGRSSENVTSPQSPQK